MPAPASTPLSSPGPSEKQEALPQAHRQGEIVYEKQPPGQPQEVHSQSQTPTQLDSRFNPPFPRSSRTSTRSQSTLEVTPSGRRRRILGHSRTASHSSKGQSSNETVLQQYQHHRLEEAGSATGGAELSLLSTYYGAEYPIVVRLPSQQARTPSSAEYPLTGQLPATPRIKTDAATAGYDTSFHTEPVAQPISARSGSEAAVCNGVTPPKPSSALFSRFGRTLTFPVLSARGPDSSSVGAGVYPPSTAIQRQTYHPSPAGDSAADHTIRHPLNQPQQQQQEEEEQTKQQGHTVMSPDHGPYPAKSPPATGVTAPFTVPTTSSIAETARAESINSTSGMTTNSGRTMLSNEPPAGADKAAMQLRPFVVRNGRSYIADMTLHYPLPVDLAELHRQSLRTLLLCQLFGGPLCCPVFSSKAPTRVLEVGCGSAFWSMMCHRYFARHGHTTISFTGIDIAPIAPGASGQGTTTTRSSGGVERGLGGNRASASSSTSSGLDGRPDKDMRWRFVQHDIRTLPWPFADGEFDLVMVKDMSLATPLTMQQTLMDEYLRVLRPGGVIEVWESDYTLRMLRPHVPQSQARPSQATKKPHDGSEDEDEASEDSESEGSDEDDHRKAANHGAYLMTANTPLSGPTNNFLVEYNSWISKALEARSLSAVPCTLIGALLRQEVDTLTAMQSKRLAVPLSEVRWEREGVGGVVTKDGKSYIETKGRRAGVGAEGGDGRPLGASQAAVRKTALLTVVMQIQSLEAILKEVSGKSQDEWDGWCGKMMNDLMRENGTSWGESLEVGAWWATKKA